MKLKQIIQGTGEFSTGKIRYSYLNSTWYTRERNFGYGSGFISYYSFVSLTVF